MEMRQRGTDMETRFHRIRWRDLLLGGDLQPLVQGRAMEIFLEEKGPLVMQPLPKEPDNIRMRQPPQERGFALQPTARWGVGRALGQEDLTGQGAEIGRTPDLVQFGDAPCTEMPDHGAVLPNAGA
jgi:hypothetical protein